MPNTVALQKKRDKKENHLSSLKAGIEAINQTEIRAKTDFDKELALYTKWKKENNIEGVKF